MDKVLTGLNFEICLTYLDDVILFSSTLDEHLKRLDMLLQRLGEYNLKLNPSKCCLLQKQLVFLGHVVSGDDLATDPAKTQLVRDWPVPENLRQLRGFLGLASYYRKFVKGYADIAAPLNRLLCKKTSTLTGRRSVRLLSSSSKTLSLCPLFLLCLMTVIRLCSTLTRRMSP